MKRTDLTKLDAAKLQAFADTTRVELASHKRAISLGQETKTADIRTKRRDIARALTLLKQKEEK